MQSSKWGNCTWDAMFYIAAGYDLNTTTQPEKDKQYKAFFKSLGNVLPCRFCRDSYRNFYAALDIDKYMSMPSCGLIKYVYDLKNLVNEKLISQEKKALKQIFHELAQKHGGIDSDDFWEDYREKAHKVCYTKSAPPFMDVVTNLLQHRAECSKQMKTCRNPATGTSHMTGAGIQDYSDADDIRLYRNDASKALAKENFDVRNMKYL